MDTAKVISLLVFLSLIGAVGLLWALVLRSVWHGFGPANQPHPHISLWARLRSARR